MAKDPPQPPCNNHCLSLLLTLHGLTFKPQLTSLRSKYPAKRSTVRPPIPVPVGTGITGPSFSLKSKVAKISSQVQSKLSKVGLPALYPCSWRLTDDRNAHGSQRRPEVGLLFPANLQSSFRSLEGTPTLLACSCLEHCINKVTAAVTVTPMNCALAEHCMSLPNFSQQCHKSHFREEGRKAAGTPGQDAWSLDASAPNPMPDPHSKRLRLEQWDAGLEN